jgi:excisionase family DNA binding protein
VTTKQRPIPRFYGVDFVAEQLGVTKKSVYRWIEAGALHFHKFQGVLRISEEDLQVFISGARR